MTRFTTTTSVSNHQDGKSLKLMTSAAHDQDLFNACVWAMGDAVKLLKKADELLNAKKPSGDIVRYAHRYFLTGKAIDQVDLLTIRGVVTMILNGLLSDVTLKVGTNPGSGGKAVHGQVSHIVGGTATKPYHNIAHHRGKDADAVYGAMKLSGKTMLSGRLGVVTLIHEASHKYAGTIDYSYFSDDSQRALGTFDDKAKALMNADSYAWFVVKIGRGSFLKDVFGERTTHNNLFHK